MDLKRVSRGSPIRIPADVWNVVLDMVRDYLRREGGGAGRLGFGSDPDVVMVKNVSDTDAPQFGVLGVHDILFSPDDNEQGFRERPALCGATPDADLHLGKFVVCLEPIVSQGIGRALLSGVTPVKVNVVDGDHKFADIADGDCVRLESATFGSAQILYAQSGTGEKWAVVRLGVPPNPFDFVAVDAIFRVDEANPDVEYQNAEWFSVEGQFAAGNRWVPKAGENEALICRLERPLKIGDWTPMLFTAFAAAYDLTPAAPPNNEVASVCLGVVVRVIGEGADWESPVTWNSYAGWTKEQWNDRLLLQAAQNGAAPNVKVSGYAQQVAVPPFFYAGGGPRITTVATGLAIEVDQWTGAFNPMTTPTPHTTISTDLDAPCGMAFTR